MNNKLDNMDKIDKFLEKYNLSKIYQEESEKKNKSQILNKWIIPNDTEALIKKLPTNKSLGLYGFIGEFYQTF